MSLIWSPEEEQMLRKCISEGMKAKQVASLLPGRTVGAVGDKARSMGCRFGTRNELGREWVIADREPMPARVASRSTVSLTAFVCGDPAPGRSALDQRQGRA